MENGTFGSFPVHTLGLVSGHGRFRTKKLLRFGIAGRTGFSGLESHRRGATGLCGAGSPRRRSRAGKARVVIVALSADLLRLSSHLDRSRRDFSGPLRVPKPIELQPVSGNSESDRGGVPETDPIGRAVMTPHGYGILLRFIGLDLVEVVLRGGRGERGEWSRWMYPSKQVELL